MKKKLRQNGVSTQFFPEMENIYLFLELVFHDPSVVKRHNFQQSISERKKKLLNNKQHVISIKSRVQSC